MDRAREKVKLFDVSLEVPGSEGAELAPVAFKVLQVSRTRAYALEKLNYLEGVGGRAPDGSAKTSTQDSLMLNRIIKAPLACAALLALTSLAPAQETLGIYFDTGATQTSTSVVPLTPFAVYVIADNIPVGISGYEFIVDVPPELLLLSGTALGPGGTVLDIDSSNEGFIVGLAGCFSGSGPHVLAELLCMAPLPTASVGLTLLPEVPSSFGGTATGYAECGTLALYPFVDAYAGPALVDADYPHAFCYCDGSGTSSPCANSGIPGNGCANSISTSGARLTRSGSPSISASTLVMEATGVPAGQPGLLFQGTNQINGGAGVMFGDGLRCTGGSVVRLQVTLGGAPSSVDLAVAGGVLAGDTRYYQLWYRDPAGSPCGSGFNLTNALEATWTN